MGQRLMAFTPEDRFERQPLVSADGQRLLVSAGRIDNRAELTREFGLAAGEASGWPDSAFVLRAYEKWGDDCARHLIGAFAFALWDAREQRLLVARSAIAGPPVFYHATPHVLAFATMPKGLFALPTVPRALDERFLADYLARAPKEPGASFYRGLSRLPSGHLLVAQRAEVKVTCYWRPDLGRELRFRRDEEYVAAFDELFERVVGDHLRSLTPAGVMLSGGFDSTSVAATAAGLLGRNGQRLATFTEVPRANFDGAIVEGRYADETPFVQAMARRYDNLDLNLIRTDGQVYLDGLDEMFEAAEVPFRNASNRVWIEAIYREAHRQGVHVLLNGGQGNLTISWGGNGVLPRLLRQGRLMAAWREGSALARRGNSRSPVHAILGRGLMPLLPLPLWFAVRRMRHPDDPAATARRAWRAFSPIHPDFAAVHKVEERARARRHDFHFRASSNTRAARLKTITGTSDAADGVNAGYRALFGVDGRDPTGDVRIIEFCVALPEEQHQRDGQTRWLLRRALADRLPPEILENRRRGLQAADWFDRLSGAHARILEELSRLERCDLAARALDLARLRRLVERMPHASADADQIMREYRGILELGLMTGCFIRWFEARG